MIHNLKLGGIIFIYIFLPFFLNSCISPEDNAIKVPVSDSTSITPEKPGHEVYTVKIKDMKFQPEEITVRKGDTVIWVNHDLVAHCVTEEKTKAWTSSKINSGATWRMVVKNSANYFCAIHQVMKGKIIVE